MVEETSGSSNKEFTVGLNNILQRLADFFDIFDLSFIISGAVSLCAIWFWNNQMQLGIPSLPEGWISVAGTIIASYVLGLICFAVARWTRWKGRAGRLEGGPHDKFLQVLEAHGLVSTPPFSDYLGRTTVRGEARLYIGLWAEIRQCPQTAASFALLRRYWVMAATYDGMVVALLVWAVVIALCTSGFSTAQPPLSPAFGAPVVAALIGSALACAFQAGRYTNYQIEELVASLARIIQRRLADVAQAADLA